MIQTYVRRAYQRLTAGRRCLPDFLIPGVQKGGTTSLYGYLVQHPCVLSAERKEIHFFEQPGNRRKGISWYRSHFPLMSERRRQSEALGARVVTGEATPFMYSMHVPRFVKDSIPDAQFVFLLRDPVARAFSHYQRNRRRGVEPLSFREALRVEDERIADDIAAVRSDPSYDDRNNREYSYIHRGMYADILGLWLEQFPRDRFFIEQSERFFSDTPAVLNEITEFLGLPPHDFDTSAKLNVGRYPDEFLIEDRRYLEGLFAPHNARLADLVGKPFWGPEMLS